MLIQTKLITTPLRSSMLLRKPLLQRLRAAELYPLILIYGPGGSGKTSLIGQWIGQAQPNVAWYSLDEEDNEPDLFFRYLLASLSLASKRLGTAFRPLLENPLPLKGENVIPQIIAALSTLDQDIHVVLDDFHRITSETIHVALARLIEYIPSRLHIIVLSRYNMPRSIDAVIIKKDRLVISASDLKFTEEETALLYKEVIPLQLSSGQIHALNRHVEGWAAGLQLIGLSVRSQGHFSDLSKILNRAHEQVANYLVYDILRLQPEKIQKFVFTTALLDRFSAELCAEVTGMPDASKILDHIDHMNLFLNALDSQHHWYRYHHMFSEVIRRQVAIADADSIPATLRKAALWSARNHHLEDALRCAFRSGDIEFTADLMEDYILGYVETFDMTGGLRWISKLPENALNQRPFLRLLQCGFLCIMNDLSELKEILTHLEKDGEPDLSRYSEDKAALCQDLMALSKCILQISYAGETAAVAELQTLRDKLGPKNPLFAGYIDTHIVSILTLKGDFPLAESFLDKLVSTAVSRPDQLIKKKVYHAHARVMIAKHRGRLRKAEHLIQQALEFFHRQGYDHNPMAFLLDRHLGNIYYSQNRLEEARQCATNAVKYFEYFGLNEEIMAGNELWFQLHLAAGDFEKANKCIQKIHFYATRIGKPRMSASADACSARLAIIQGNLTAAGLWSQRRKVQPDEPFSLLYAMECLTQARLFFARRQYSAASHLLEILRQRCVQRQLGELLLQINILHSATLQSLNLQKPAISLLKEALAFSEMEGYIRPFVNDAKLIAPVLKHIMEEKPRDLSPDHLGNVLSACDIPLIASNQPTPLNVGHHERLTQREIEILHLVANGFQNKEIAQKAHISITTVKSHVSNILAKLNVKTRTQAILKAKEYLKSSQKPC